MKNILLGATILLANGNFLAMESNELTEKEQACYTWFTEQQKTLPSSFQALSPEDRKTFETQVKFQDDPEAVTRSRHKFAEAFIASAQQAGRELPYDQDMLKNTFIKMTKMMHAQSIQEPTNLLTARMYVFSSLLTPAEKTTYSQENYCKNPDATKVIVRKWSGLVCQELIKLKQLEESAKAQKEQELYQEVVERLEKTYKK